MPKAYWISFYRAILAAGGKFLARSNAAHAYELGAKLRTVVVEFPSVAHAVACHDGPAYTEALRVLGEGAADRDFRIVEGVE